jgi:hypothetical protein
MQEVGEWLGKQGFGRLRRQDGALAGKLARKRENGVSGEVQAARRVTGKSRKAAFKGL